MLERRGSVYILTLTGSGEHRLNPTLIDSIQSALRHLRPDNHRSRQVLLQWIDLGWAQPSQSCLHLMDSKLQSLITDLVSLPMPTIPAVNGHASAAGMILVSCHDYIVLRRDKRVLYMSEMDVGLVLPDWFMVVVKCKILDANVRREVVMTAAKSKLFSNII